MDYTTTAEVKAFGGLTGSIDTALALLVTAASAFIDSYCDRDFALHTGATEIRNGTGTKRIMLFNTPIASVASVSVNGQALKASTGPSDPLGYVYDKDLVYLRDGCFTKGAQNVVIVYTGGFATPPADIKQACIELVLYKWAKRDRQDKKMETLQGQNVMFESRDMPEGVKTVLNQYRRWMV
jgi:hypothetical protein